jgi:hypothetical protein
MREVLRSLGEKLASRSQNEVNRSPKHGLNELQEGQARTRRDLEQKTI